MEFNAQLEKWFGCLGNKIVHEAIAEHLSIPDVVAHMVWRIRHKKQLDAVIEQLREERELQNFKISKVSKKIENSTKFQMFLKKWYKISNVSKKWISNVSKKMDTKFSPKISKELWEKMDYP